MRRRAAAPWTRWKRVRRPPPRSAARPSVRHSKPRDARPRAPAWAGEAVPRRPRHAQPSLPRRRDRRRTPSPRHRVPRRPPCRRRRRAQHHRRSPSAPATPPAAGRATARVCSAQAPICSGRRACARRVGLSCSAHPDTLRRAGSRHAPTQGHHPLRRHQVDRHTVDVAAPADHGAADRRRGPGRGDRRRRLQRRAACPASTWIGPLARDVQCSVRYTEMRTNTETQRSTLRTLGDWADAYAQGASPRALLERYAGAPADASDDPVWIGRASAAELFSQLSALEAREQNFADRAAAASHATATTPTRC